MASRKWIKPKKTYYNGILFKSNLEAKVAEAFDELRIRWEYEETCFRDEGFSYGQYTPDFYLPVQDLYVEVAGVWDDRHERNAVHLINLTGKSLVEIDGTGEISGITVYNNQTVFYGRPLVICDKCLEWYIAEDEMSYPKCPACGSVHGDYASLDKDELYDLLADQCNLLDFAADNRAVRKAIRTLEAQKASVKAAPDEN